MTREMDHFQSMGAGELENSLGINEAIMNSLKAQGKWWISNSNCKKCIKRGKLPIVGQLLTIFPWFLIKLRCFLYFSLIFYFIFIAILIMISKSYFRSLRPRPPLSLWNPAAKTENQPKSPGIRLKSIKTKKNA